MWTVALPPFGLDPRDVFPSIAITSGCRPVIPATHFVKQV